MLLLCGAVGNLLFVYSATYSLALKKFPSELNVSKISSFSRFFGVILMLWWLQCQVKFTKNNYYSLLFYSFVVLLGAVLFSGLYDISHDGRWYHAERVISSQNLFAQSYLDPKSPAIVYPMLVDDIRSFSAKLFPGFSVYSSVSHNIAIALYSSFYYVANLKSNLNKFVVGFIPIAPVPVIGQLNTFYVDGFIFSIYSIAALEAYNLMQQSLQLEGQCEIAGRLSSNRLSRIVHSFNNIPKSIRLRGLAITLSVVFLGLAKGGFVILAVCLSLFVIASLTVSNMLSSMTNKNEPILTYQLKPISWQTLFLLFKRPNLKCVFFTVLVCLVASSPYLLYLIFSFSQNSYGGEVIASSPFSLMNLKEIAQAVLSQDQAINDALPDFISQNSIGKFIGYNVLSFFPQNLPFSSLGNMARNFSTHEARVSGLGTFFNIVILFSFTFSCYFISSFFFKKPCQDIPKHELSPLAAYGNSNLATISLVCVGTLTATALSPLGFWARLNPQVYYSSLLFLVTLYDTASKSTDSVRRLNQHRGRYFMPGLRWTSFVLVIIALCSSLPSLLGIISVSSMQYYRAYVEFPASLSRSISNFDTAFGADARPVIMVEYNRFAFDIAYRLQRRLGSRLADLTIVKSLSECPANALFAESTKMIKPVKYCMFFE